MVVADRGLQLAAHLRCEEEVGRALHEAARGSLHRYARASGAAAVLAKVGSPVVEVAVGVLEVLEVGGVLDYGKELRSRIELVHGLEAHLYALVVNVGKAQAHPGAVGVVHADALADDALLAGLVSRELALGELRREVRDVHPVVVVVVTWVVVPAHTGDRKEALLVVAVARDGTHAHVSDPDLVLALFVSPLVCLGGREAHAANGLGGGGRGREEHEVVHVPAQKHGVVLDAPAGDLVKALQAGAGNGKGSQRGEVALIIAKMLHGGVHDALCVPAKGATPAVRIVAPDHVPAGRLVEVHERIAEVVVASRRGAVAVPARNHEGVGGRAIARRKGPKGTARRDHGGAAIWRGEGDVGDTHLLVQGGYSCERAVLGIPGVDVAARHVARLLVVRRRGGGDGKLVSARTVQVACDHRHYRGMPAAVSMAGT